MKDKNNLKYNDLYEIYKIILEYKHYWKYGGKINVKINEDSIKDFETIIIKRMLDYNFIKLETKEIILSDSSGLE